MCSIVNLTELSVFYSKPNRTLCILYSIVNLQETEFKEFEPQLKFETQLKYGLFHLKLYSMFKI